MPRVAGTFIKTGLFYFLGALLTGLAHETNGLQFAGITPLFWHMLMVGWITQIIFGVSMWMLYPPTIPDLLFQFPIAILTFM